jgi:23S rRNA pseudouridine1911/1915/1917 synthase
MKTNFRVAKEDEGERLDQVLAKRWPEYSRSFFSKLIKSENVTVDGNSSKPSYLVKKDNEITVIFTLPPSDMTLKPEKIKLNVLFENEDVLVINKQPGIPVHPGAGNSSHTLVNALLNYFPSIQDAVVEKGNPISEARPGLVHRLDKDTSGVMIVAKNPRAMHSLSRQIQNRTVTKEYVALCFGWPKDEQSQLINYVGRHPKDRKIMADIGIDKGKEAISDYQVNKIFTYGKHKLSLIEFNIHTGRTHQIRLQSKLMGCPVMGDKIYSNKDSITLSQELHIERQLLHAHKLALTLPGDNKLSLFIAPIPNDFKIVIDKLNVHKND